MNSPVIQFESVAFHYGPQRPVLVDASFHLDPHSRLGLTGPNGCGKSTLLLLIVGLLKPHTGAIRVFGRPCRHEYDFVHVRHHVGLVFQDADDQLFCPTVAEDVAFGPLNQGVPAPAVRDIVARTLAQVGLAGFEDRITYRLSGGEKRLVALATVLAMNPDVLLLDEPTAGLDPETARRVVDLLASLPAAMIIVSHDAALLDQLTTRRLILNQGQLTEPHS